MQCHIFALYVIFNFKLVFCTYEPFQYPSITYTCMHKRDYNNTISSQVVTPVSVLLHILYHMFRELVGRIVRTCRCGGCFTKISVESCRPPIDLPAAEDSDRLAGKVHYCYRCGGSCVIWTAPVTMKPKLQAVFEGNSCILRNNLSFLCRDFALGREEAYLQYNGFAERASITRNE